MSAEEMEEIVDKICKERLGEMVSGFPRDLTLKMAVLDGFKAGMEAAQSVYKS